MTDRTISVASEIAVLLRAGANVIPIDSVPAPCPICTVPDGICWEDDEYDCSACGAHGYWPGLRRAPDPVWVALQHEHEWRGYELATGDGTPVFSWTCECGAHTNSLTSHQPGRRLWFTITTRCPKCKGNALTGDANGHITSCMGCLGSPGRVAVVEASIEDIVQRPNGEHDWWVVLNTRPVTP